MIVSFIRGSSKGRRAMKSITFLLAIMATALLVASGVAWAVTKPCPPTPKKCLGTSGADVLKSTSKNNKMLGKGGNDTYTNFVKPKTGYDTINDTGGKDKLVLTDYTRDEIYGHTLCLDEDADGKTDGVWIDIPPSPDRPKIKNAVKVLNYFNDKDRGCPGVRGPGYIENIQVKGGGGPGGTQGGNGRILSPFDESETWYVCRGYNTETHSKNSRYALDFIIDKPATVGSLGCTSQNVNASFNEPVFAPVPGHTSACWNNTQFVCVQSSFPTSKGYYFIIGHVDPGSRLLNADVQAGTEVIGRLAPAGSLNGGIAHIHIEARPEPGGQSVEFTSANGTAICQQAFQSDGSQNQYAGKAVHGC
jgi:hypothetical protein